MSTWSSLKIELIATGDQANLWGTTTNNNFQYALEEAITASGDVTFASNNQTLTLIDSNLSQTGRKLRLNLTGATGGSTRSLFVPAIQKQYIINNGCADSILVTNGTDPTPTGTGVTVPAGKSLIVFNDGTNITAVVSYAPSLTLGTALPVTSGGTGNTSFTGNGALYANAGGTAIQSGTLPIASGGTGQTTANAALNALLPAQGLYAGKFLTTDGSNTSWADNPLGTVTSVSVVTANGLAGTVTNPTTTPAITLTTSVTGILKGNGTAISAASSGTDYAPATSGTAILAGNGAGGFTSLPAASTGILRWNGSAYVWTTDYAPATTGSTILAGNGSGGFTNLPAPSSGFLQWTGSAYAWNAAAGLGSVTSIDVSGGTTGLTTSGGPVTTAGTITLAGTLAVANGGTGQTSYTNGQILIGNSSGNTLTKATITSGTGVNVTNGAGSITLSATGEFAGSSAAGASIKLYEDTDNGTNYVSLKAPDLVASDITWTLPDADGTIGQALVTNGSGTLSWTTITSGATISNDTSTASNLYPAFLGATSGTALNIYTSNAKLLYKPSTGDFQASQLVAGNGLILNSTTIAESYTIGAGTNAMSVGPITVASGQSVTVSSGQRWVVI